MKKQSTYKRITDISLYDFMRRIPDEQTAEQYIIQLRWRGEPVCPKCGGIRIASTKDRKPQPFRCRDCRSHFSVRTGTILAQSNVKLDQFLYVVYLLTVHPKGVSSLQIAREVGITQKTAWFLAHRIRKAWEQGGDLFSGPVEVDETYIGGKEKNKHESKKLKQGRGTVGKAAVIGALTRRGGKVQAKPIQSTDKATLQGFVRETTKDGEQLFTDEHKGYAGMPEFDHSAVKHSIGEYVDGMIHTNGIESFWALLKRGYIGTHHHMSKKHLHRYVDEFSTRFNMRQQGTMAKIEQTIAGADGVELHWKELTG